MFHLLLYPPWLLLSRTCGRDGYSVTAVISQPSLNQSRTEGDTTGGAASLSLKEGYVPGVLRAGSPCSKYSVPAVAVSGV